MNPTSPFEDLADACADRLDYKPPVIPIERIWKHSHREETVKQRFGTGTWRVTDLLDAIKDEPVFDLPLAHIDLGAHDFDGSPGGLIACARHMRHTMDADLDVPVILDEWGGLLDGQHRIIKALFEGRATVKAKRVPPGTRPTEP